MLPISCQSCITITNQVKILDAKISQTSEPELGAAPQKDLVGPAPGLVSIFEYRTKPGSQCFGIPTSLLLLNPAVSAQA